MWQTATRGLCAQQSKATRMIKQVESWWLKAWLRTFRSSWASIALLRSTANNVHTPEIQWPWIPCLPYHISLSMANFLKKNPFLIINCAELFYIAQPKKVAHLHFCATHYEDSLHLNLNRHDYIDFLTHLGENFYILSFHPWSNRWRWNLTRNFEIWRRTDVSSSRNQWPRNKGSTQNHGIEQDSYRGCGVGGWDTNPPPKKKTGNLVVFSE